MSTLQFVALAAYGLVLVVWIARHIMLTRVRGDMLFLTPQHPRYEADDRPLVSVLIPAKDEEDAIAECLQSVLDQHYLRLEVIVIDDRSADGTANVVREFASRDSRVRLVASTDLPPGWTGKNHALACGVREAHGDWLLFIDADTQHEPDNVSILMEYARREQADVVSILPRMRNDSFWESVVQPLAGMILMLNYPLKQVNNDADAKHAFANGQYILIRRSTYNALGGHASVRDKFVEDIHLARIARDQGYRSRVALAPELSSTRMYRSLSGLVQGWSRILYAAYDYSTARLSAVLVGLMVFSISAYLVLAGIVAASLAGHATPFLVALSGLCAAHLVLQNWFMARAYTLTASQRRYVLFYGLAAGVVSCILASAVRKCLTHRLEWRGTHYDKLQDVEPIVLTLPAPAGERPLRKAA